MNIRHGVWREGKRIKPMPRFWYAAYTISPDPVKLKEKFKKAKFDGVSVFVPRASEKRLVKKKIQVRSKFFFPGYFFIKFDRKVYSTQNLERLFGMNVLCSTVHHDDGGVSKIPIRVPVEELRAIKVKVEKYNNKEKKNYDSFVDRSVIIKEGPFREFSGMCTSVTSGGVADVTVKFFDRSISAKVNADFLEIM